MQAPSLGTADGAPADTEKRILPRGLRPRPAVLSDRLELPRAPARILVVDDEPGIREIIAADLRRGGFRVDTAGDGGAGWVALCANPYDLLIADHLMPRVTGLDLVRRLREVQLSLPCILISGDLPERADLAALLRPGAALAKPFLLTELRAKVEELVQAFRWGSAPCGGGNPLELQQNASA